MASAATRPGITLTPSSRTRISTPSMSARRGVDAPVVVRMAAKKPWLTAKNTTVPAAAPARASGVSRCPGGPMARETASPRPTAVSSWPELNADFTTDRLSMSCERSVAMAKA